MRDAGIPNLIKAYSEGYNWRELERKEETINVAGRTGTLLHLKGIINDNWRNIAFIWFEPSNDRWMWLFVRNNGVYSDISEEVDTIIDAIKLDPERYPNPDGNAE